MATESDFYRHVLDCLSHIDGVTSARMMGEYCVYIRGKIFGDICDNRLLVKRTAAAERLLPDCSLEYPYQGSKQLMRVVRARDLENRELMSELLNGMYDELPEPRKKKK